MIRVVQGTPGSGMSFKPQFEIGSLASQRNTLNGREKVLQASGSKCHLKHPFVSCDATSRLTPFDGSPVNGVNLENLISEVLRNQHTLLPVRVIVSPELAAKSGSTGQNKSDWKLTR